MRRENYLVRCLPLLAAVLGDRYGIEVRVHGEEAKTDGKVIHIPALAPDCDEEAFSMVRGYIDHESAHIRYTDFEVMSAAKLDPLTRWLFNVIEDWRVERKLATAYPGCRQNLRHVAKRLFGKEQTLQAEKEDALTGLLRYVLLTVRSWEVPELATIGLALRAELSPAFGVTCDAIDGALADVRGNCPDTKAAISHAYRLSSFLRQCAAEKPQQEATESPSSSRKEEGDSGQTANREEKSDEKGGNQVTANIFPENIGEMLQGEITREGRKDASAGELRIAECGQSKVIPMTEASRQAVLKSSAGLRARIQGLLQSSTRQRVSIGRRGKLDPMRMYRSSVGDTKVFRSYSERRGLNTAVHILLDASGSMDGNRIEIANKSCFAIAHALNQVHGVNTAITTFQGYSHPQVVPLLKHGEKIRQFSQTQASGGTPLSSALWWVLQRMVLLREHRKIILILTDGSPDCGDPYQEAMDAASAIGVELYGIGIQTEHIKSILPETSRSIDDLNGLPSAMFSVLGNGLTKEVL